MEEDIKILEELCKKTIVDILGYSRFVLRSEYRLPLENLLKRYKELEEENKFLAKERKGLETLVYLRDGEESIPISVIQNKINGYLEYDKIYKTHTSDGRENFTMEYFKAQTLKELLEERNK